MTRTVHGIDLTQPDGVARLLAHHRGRWGTATMTAPTGTQTTETTKTETKPETTGQQTTTETTKTESEAKFTQADLDRVLQTRLAEEQGKWQKKLDDAAALAGKSETDKLTIERDQAKAAATETTQKAAQRIAQTEAKVAAISAGANPERVTAIVRNADLDSAVKDGEVDEAAIKAAVEKVLTEYPEWKATAGSSVTASGGEMNGGGNNGKPTFTRKQLEEMPPEEMAKRIDEINAAVAEGRVTG
ncbi:DUF4355 domain-containing protein [Blastococcus sp. CT_GayMR16]|uniref:capsid assembly scaffolding protein Gp46 family protein n=1 Tax=Blastococcus sp. CT_GayMR16 TaxID=2559607 RepID=UPI001074422E|nr:DUF4355 domain-containing protein [Blastococcus sp. CT_GayMR16]TFV91397.1 DUF4355 domain-containing protein [Blastococcus sp. CT_GayMR16]